MNKTIDGENSFYEFSFSEFMDIQNLDYSKKNSSYCSQTYGNKDFYGTENFSESMQLLKNGQKEKPLEIGDFMKEINYDFSTEKQMFLSYEGFSVDISEYATGNPECILSIADYESNDKNITVFYNCSYGSWIDSYTIENYGKMILSIIEILQSQNFNIRLVAIDRTIDDLKKIHNVKIIIKDFNESIDRDKISYCLVNPSFLRRNLFKMYEHILDENYRIKHFDGYGNPIEILKRENEKDFYIDSPDKNQNKKHFQERLISILK